MFTVNGKEFAASGLTVSEFLAQEAYDLQYIVIELNGEVLPRRRYGSTAFQAGDSVEIVSFVGGG